MRQSAPASRQVAWFEVHLFTTSKLERVDGWPAAGTPEWCALDDDDPRKIAAVLDYGQHWALHLDGRQEALAQASRDVAQAIDCQPIARGVLRQEWRRKAGVYIPRQVVA